MTPAELEIRLRRITNQLNLDELSYNHFFQFSKPTEDLLVPYRKFLRGKSSNLVLSHFLVPMKIVYLILKSILISLLRKSEERSWHSQESSRKDVLVVSHFTQAQRPGETDVHYGELLNRSDTNVFYLNSTRVPHRELVRFYPKSEQKNLIFMTKSLSLKSVLAIHERFLSTSMKLIWSSFSNSYDRIDKSLLIEAAIRQHARPTMANKFLEVRFTETVNLLNPARIIMTFEGHSHELVLINLIHSKFPEIEIAAYQHAPVVPEQYGLLRNLRLLSSRDQLFTSGELTYDFFRSLREDLQISVVGSRKHKEVTLNQSPIKRIKVLGASEGSVISITKFIQIFSRLSVEFPGFEFKVRIHPSVPESTVIRILKAQGVDRSLISHNSLLDDLLDSTYCIYQSSAVAIEGLAFGVTPLYFNELEGHGLNPLFFANFHQPIFRNVEEFIVFFSQVNSLSLNQHGLPTARLQEVAQAYFSKIENGFPKPS